MLLLMWLSRSYSILKYHYSKMKRTKILLYSLTIIHIIISGISGGLAFFNVGTDTIETTSNTINIIIGAISMIVAILAVIIMILKLNEIIVSERYSITKFSKLVREIEIVLYSDIEGFSKFYYLFNI